MSYFKIIFTCSEWESEDTFFLKILKVCKNIKKYFYGLENCDPLYSDPLKFALRVYRTYLNIKIRYENFLNLHRLLSMTIFHRHWFNYALHCTSATQKAINEWLSTERSEHSIVSLFFTYYYYISHTYFQLLILIKKFRLFHQWINRSLWKNPILNLSRMPKMGASFFLKLFVKDARWRITSLKGFNAFETRSKTVWKTESNINVRTID